MTIGLLTGVWKRKLELKKFPIVRIHCLNDDNSSETRFKLIVIKCSVHRIYNAVLSKLFEYFDGRNFHYILIAVAKIERVNKKKNWTWCNAVKLWHINHIKVGLKTEVQERSKGNLQRSFSNGVSSGKLKESIIGVPKSKEMVQDGKQIDAYSGGEKNLL